MQRILLLISAAIMISACNNSGTGILYSISEEKALADKESLSNELSVTGMAVVGSDYYLAAGPLYRRGVAEEAAADWEIVSPPPDTSSVLCVRLVEFDGSLYAVFASVDGTTSKLFSMASGSGSWSEVSSFADLRVVNIVATASALIVSAKDGTTYTSYISADGAAYSPINLPSQYTSAHDAAEYSGNTWILSGKYLYSDQSGNYLLVTDADGPTTVNGYGGIFSSVTLNALFVTSQEGYIYAWDGSTWSQTLVSDDDEGIPLHDLAQTTILGESTILIGSDLGYYEILFVGDYTTTFSAVYPGGELLSSSDENYQRVPLRSSVVRFLVSDDARHTIFACTSGEGLWINPIDDSDPDAIVRKWDRQ